MRLLTTDCSGLLVSLRRVCVGGIGIFICSLTIASFGAGIDPHRFLAALAIVEGAPGGTMDHGLARGPYQMHLAAMRDVQKVTGWTDAIDRLNQPEIARRYALQYLRILSSHLTSGGCEISPATMWAAWNVGPTRFRARGFSLNRCPLVTRERARAIEIYYHHHRP